MKKRLGVGREGGAHGDRVNVLSHLLVAPITRMRSSVSVVAPS